MQTLSASTAQIDTRSGGKAWWRGAVGYEVYVRSFFDTNGDGVGDLPGVTARLDYLANLGVDVVWLTPFFPSPGLDHGYDVSDYCEVDPVFGTLADFDHLVAEAHRRGLRIFVDVVPNHTSDQHPWFRRALADPDSPFRRYYLFRPPAADGGPPNNWVSHFGGPAWSLDPSGTGQYYCHLFLPEQPDLDWSNPDVLQEFRTILRFWCERGVDGFRVDVAHGLAKDPELRDNPQLRPVTPDMHPTDVFMSFRHVHDLHQAETAAIFRDWRAEVARHGAVLLGEMDTRDIVRFGDYIAGRDGLDLGFVLKIGLNEWEPSEIIHDLIAYSLAANGGAAWEVSNHDQARATSRFGGGATGLRRAAALTTLMVCLDGMTFIYQGEELGLPDAVTTDGTLDPMGGRSNGGWGRDVARGAMPWDSSHLNGFSTAPRAWLATEALPPELTAAVQVARPDSTWHRYRDLVGLRKRCPELWTAPLGIRLRTESVLVLERGSITIIANLGPTEVEHRLPRSFTVLFESSRGAAMQRDAEVVVEPESTVLLQH